MNKFFKIFKLMLDDWTYQLEYYNARTNRLRERCVLFQQIHRLSRQLYAKGLKDESFELNIINENIFKSM